MNKFKLTNGTDTVNFLSGNESAGALIQSWEPESATYKDDGVVNSPIADGTRLAFKRWQWPTESIDFAVYRDTRALVISRIREIETLIQQAINFWDESHHENNPVWVEAFVDGEEGSRYALVIDARLVGRPNPYAQPFGMRAGGSSTGIMTLNFVRTHWQDQEPGSLSANIVQADNNYVSTNDIDQPVDLQTWVWASPMYNSDANINTITTFGNGGTGLSGNVYDTLTDFFVDWTVGDYVEFAAPALYRSIAFNIGNPASSALGLTFEYDTGAGFSTLTSMQDGTNGMTESGVMLFTPPGDWDTTTYAIRITLSAKNGVTSSPTRNPSTFREFSPNQPFFIVPGATTTGDIEDALKVKMFVPNIQSGLRKLVVGSRSLDRGGTDFLSYINISSDASANDAQVTVTAISGSFTSTHSSTDDLLLVTPGKEGLKVTDPGFPSAGEICDITINSSIADAYRGRFRVFVRVLFELSSAGYDDWYLYGYTSTSAGNYTNLIGETLYNRANYFTSTLSDLVYFDMGIADIYGQKNLATSVGGEDLVITLGGGVTNSDADTPAYMTLIDIILIPTDEIYFELDLEGREGYVVTIDSATDPVRTLCYLENDSGNFIGQVPLITPGKIETESGQDTRFYLIELNNIRSGNFNIFGVQVNRVKRYLGFR